MPFRFSLEEVLDYRQRIEESRQRDMLDVQRQVERVEDLLDQARERRVHYQRELNYRARRGISPGHRDLYMNYLTGLDMLMERSEEHLAEMRRELERRRALLAQAARERQVLEEIQSAELRDYETSERRTELKEFDAIALRNFLVAGTEKTAQGVEGTMP